MERSEFAQPLNNFFFISAGHILESSFIILDERVIKQEKRYEIAFILISRMS